MPPQGKKLTLAVTDAMHERLGEIAGELGITMTEEIRRDVELGFMAHKLIEAAGGDVYICTKNPDGSFSQQFVISDMMH